MKEEIVILSLKCVKNSKSSATSLTSFVCLSLNLNDSVKKWEASRVAKSVHSFETGRIVGSNWVQNKHVFTSNWTETIKFLSFK